MIIKKLVFDSDYEYTNDLKDFYSYILEKGKILIILLLTENNNTFEYINKRTELHINLK